MKNKRGMQLAISTLILLVLGILVLIGLIAMLVMGWGDFKTQIGVILGSDTAQAQKNCKIQCQLENNYDYCCEEKGVEDNMIITCQDESLKTDCRIDCSEASCGDF